MADYDLIRKANALRNWALSQRLMAAGAPDDDVDDDENKHVAQAFSAELPASLQKSGVTGVGITDVGRTIILYTASNLRAGERSVLPETLFDDVTVEYRRASPFSLKDDMPQVVFGQQPGTFKRKRYTCGSSISVANRRSAGTLGALLRNGDGALFGLTNNHVTGGCNYTRAGMPVTAPGVKDISSTNFPPFTIGAHATSIPMTLGEPDTVDHKNNTDAAVFRIDNDKLVTSMQRDHFDTPDQAGEFVAHPQDGTAVKKVGRTTGLTYGIVETRMIGALSLDYDIPTYHSATEKVQFRGRVYFEPVYLIRGKDGSFSDRGDSGSLVVTDDGAGNEKALGLIFAGDASENISYMLPIGPVLDRLGMSLVKGLG